MYNEAEKELRVWLKDRRNNPLSASGQMRPMFYIKVPVAGRFYYLYGGGLHGMQNMNQTHYPLHFLGVYSKQQEKIYAEQRWFVERYPNMTDARLLTEVEKEISPQVKERIEDILRNDRSKLEIAELSEEYKDFLENYKARELSIELKKAIVAGVTSADVKYHNESFFGGWTDTVLLNFLEKPTETVQKQAEEYIQNNQNSMNMRKKSVSRLRTSVDIIRTGQARNGKRRSKKPLKGKNDLKRLTLIAKGMGFTVIVIVWQR